MPQHFSFIAENEDVHIRLDKVLVLKFPGKSRQFLQKLFWDNHVQVDGKPVKTSFKLEKGQKVDVMIPDPKELHLKPVDIPLDIVFENKDLLVLNKQAGLVVHPGTYETHIDDSLVNAILHHCKGELSGISGVLKPGIVHRLDKDTSGLLIVAKNDFAHHFLAQQFKDREIKKIYFALVTGHVSPKKGTIEASIGRSARNRKKMAVVREGRGKTAITHYEVVEYFNTDIEVEPRYTLVKIQLVTGRTHQIRVHFTNIGHHLVGDPLYGRDKLNKFFERKLGLNRQFLHAAELSFTLPKEQKRATFTAALPDDLEKTLEFLRKA